MKYLILFPLSLVVLSCTTTTTTSPNGTKTVVNAQDPKVVKAIVEGVSQAVAQAAIQVIEQQANKQNGNP